MKIGSAGQEMSLKEAKEGDVVRLLNAGSDLYDSPVPAHTLFIRGCADIKADFFLVWNLSLHRQQGLPGKARVEVLTAARLVLE